MLRCASQRARASSRKRARLTTALAFEGEGEGEGDGEGGEAIARRGADAARQLGDIRARATTTMAMAMG